MKTLPVLYRALAAACALFAITPMTSAQIVYQGPIQMAPAGYAPFYFNRNKPKLVVLLHGVTPQQGEAPDQRIGGSGHARHYWGFQFIKALQGECNGDQMNVITPTNLGNFRGRSPVAADWHPATLDASSYDLAPICFPTSPLGLLPEYSGNVYLKNYISLMCGGPNTMVMINTRKGDKHLMPQVAETIDEIYASYLLAFGGLPQAKQPQIYLVTHSFGGIIARTILANPSAGDLWGNKLTVEQRAKADYLRKRVVLLCTLACPHEGTLIGDPAGDVANYISANGTNVITQFFKTFNQYTPDFLDLDFTSADINQKATDFVEIALDAVAGKRDCLEDLRRVNEYNAGILKPNVERRTYGEAVPIFTLGGRCPGGRFIDQSRRFPLLHIVGEVTPIHAINNIDVITGPRFSSDAAALNLIEGVMHLYGYGRAGKRPWGTAEAAIGDRFSSPWTGVGPATARSLAAPWSPDGRLLDLAVNFLIGDPYVQYEADGEWDSDGFLAWDSANAYHLTGSNFYRLYDEAFYGSNLPWDIDNHGSIMHSAANGAWIYNELITQAGPMVSQGKRRSIWNINDQPQTPSKALRVVVEEIEDIQQTAAKKLDVGSGADFMITVRINELATTRILPEGDKHVLLPPFIHSGIPNTVIPIQISVTELDNPGAGDPHDICVLSPQKGQSTLYLFYDTRTNKIMGDKMANGGESFFVSGWTSTNQIRCKLRITQDSPS